MGRTTVVLNTGRTIAQGKYREDKKLSMEYLKSVAVCQVSQKDAEAIGIKEGDIVLIRTNFGSVAVHASVSENLPPGVAFMPYGPWSNQVIDTETDSTGMPRFKGVIAEIEAAPDEKVKTTVELLKILKRT